MIGDTLLAAKAALESSTLFAKWKRDNPKEFARIEAYWENGGEFPVTINPFGLHYALDAKAYRDSLPLSHAITPPSAMAKAIVPDPDGADIGLFPSPASAGGAGGPIAAIAADLSLPFIPV